MREEERDQINRQVQEVEEVIERELEEYRAQNRPELDQDNSMKQDLMEVKDDADEILVKANTDIQMEDEKSDRNDQTENRDEESPFEKSELERPSETTRVKDDDHGGEELVEGHEDDVIY